VSALRPCNPYRRSCCNSPGRREADCFRKAPRDLWPMLGQLVGDFQRHTDSARRLRLTRFPSATLWSRIDLDAFAILMRNLVENALAPGDADKEVVIAAEDTGSDRVANRGTIVSSQEIAKLRAIVSGADGRLDLISPCGATRMGSKPSCIYRAAEAPGDIGSARRTSTSVWRRNPQDGRSKD